MGIHGLLAQIGNGERISLAKLSAQYYTANDRPFRLAIDISIWLFQIQSGKGGSNPALRTFYYRLLRLLSLNIHPLFVFDGPNKPLFKRNKKVGGPGVRVASVPEFLAKQLLKQFGFPWHVAPGEAEAECALLQREGIVDAVLSEDVDTLMFGSGVTLRNWTAENTTKTPTHVDLHRAEATKERRGMDREGMILVALMSGGDYVPEGIPGCGPKVACDAARAGFGRDLCALSRLDKAGLQAWKDRLTHEIRTNESKFFSRRNKQFTIPDDFPSREVLGFYTHPCVSTRDKLDRLRRELQWDQAIDFAALRTFTSDAFDWRCIGGAKKFIKNLAPALLVREIRLYGCLDEQLELEEQEAKEKQFVQAIHGQRNHSTTDGELEYRIIFMPEKLVPIDLSLEDDDDDFVPAGGDVSDLESEAALPSSTQDDAESEAPSLPKKRNFKPFDPSKPEKLWLMKPFLQVGCPLLVEEYEAASRDPRELLKRRRNARAAAKGETNIHAAKPRSKKAKAKESDMPANALMAYAKVTKAVGERPLKELNPATNSRSNSQISEQGLGDEKYGKVNAFKLPSTQIPTDFELSKANRAVSSKAIEVLDLAMSSPVKPVSRPSRTALVKKGREATMPSSAPLVDSVRQNQSTPKRTSRKRPSPDLSSPLASQRIITSYYSPSPRKSRPAIGTEAAVISLISSPNVLVDTGSPTPKTTRPRADFRRASASPLPARSDFSPGKLPDTVTKRRKKSPLKRWETEPALKTYDDEGDEELASPSLFLHRRGESASDNLSGGFLREDEDELEGTPSPSNEAEIGIPAYRTAFSYNEALDEPLGTSVVSAARTATETNMSKPIRRLPRQVATKKRIQLRESLEGAWKEVAVEAIDMTGDGSGWAASGGTAKLTGWRKSGVEVLDLTGV